ncbi:MAG: hypothetical protein P1U32_02200 [Legionellaceae bacterium]|nr:hypothetical protein [Legionellaceae bacterium]
MGDLKSKLPDVKELTGMLGKLFTDVKKSVVEIADAYKEKHKDDAPEEKAAAPEKKKAKAEAATETSEQKAAPKKEAPKAEASSAEAPKTEEPPAEK